MPRRPADQTTSRDEVLLAAAHVFRQRGYHGATMQDIGDALGLRQSSLYHYYPSKHALFLTLLNHGLERLTSAVLSAADPALPPPARLASAIEAYLCGVAAHPDIALVTILEVRALLANPAERRAYIAKRDYLEGLFRAILNEGVARGDFAPTDTSLVSKMLLSVHNWFVMWYRPDGPLPAHAIAAFVSQFFIAALRDGRGVDRPAELAPALGEYP